ncbi:hypothetical protein C4901_09085 [Acidiferrobacter sp. SPIII_3]|nr:hypothetical protein C4901_09085 [Acidiferrobacter sp. SPIII_3]
MERWPGALLLGQGLDVGHRRAKIRDHHLSQVERRRVLAHRGQHDIEHLVRAQDVRQVDFRGIGVEHLPELPLREQRDAAGHAAKRVLHLVHVDLDALRRPLAELVEEHIQGHALGALRGHAQELFDGGPGLQKDGKVGEVVAQLAGFESPNKNGERLVGALAVVVRARIRFARRHEVQQSRRHFVSIAGEDGVVSVRVLRVVHVEHVKFVLAAAQARQVAEDVAGIGVQLRVHEKPSAAQGHLLPEKPQEERRLADTRRPDQRHMAHEQVVGDPDGRVGIASIPHDGAGVGVDRVGGQHKPLTRVGVDRVEPFTGARPGQTRAAER